MDDNNENVTEETEELIDTEQEHLDEDTDADTRDVEDAAKNDEEQEVEDTDADTRDVMTAIDALASSVSEMRGQLIAMKSMFSQFVDAGGVIREEDSALPVDDDNDAYDYVPIEELDLTL